MANFGYFVANIRIFWCTCTGLNNAVVSQNILLTLLTILILLCNYTSKALEQKGFYAYLHGMAILPFGSRTQKVWWTGLDG